MSTFTRGPMYQLVVMRHADFLPDEISRPPIEVIRQVNKAIKGLRAQFKDHPCFVSFSDDPISTKTAQMLSHGWVRSNTLTWKQEEIKTPDLLFQTITRSTHPDKPLVFIGNEHTVN